MIVSSYRINDMRQLTPVAPEKVARAAREPDVRLWLDLREFTPDELEGWLDTLEIEGLDRQLCLKARGRSAFYPLNREIVFVIPVLTQETALREVDYLVCLCKKNLLLTLHGKVVFTLEDLVTSDAWLPQPDVAGLVSAMMLEQSLMCLQATADVRESVLALEKRMDQVPDTVEVEEILHLRSEVVTLGELVSDQLPCVKALTTINKTYFQLQDAREYMSCALANLESAQLTLTWMDQRIVALRAGFQMHGQEKTNRRLGILTILSAIFMPITLLAGVWGMNFAVMPELSYRFAYPLALGLMAVIGTGMYLFFRRTGWFG